MAFAAVTQKNTGMVLTTSEERGEANAVSHAHGGKQPKPSTLQRWVQPGSQYTCGLAEKWKQGHTTRQGPMGIMTHFPCSYSLLLGRPRFSGTKKEHTGPLSKQCSCGKDHRNRNTRANKENSNTCSDTCTTSRRKWRTEQNKGVWQWRAHLLHPGRCG